MTNKHTGAFIIKVFPLTQVFSSWITYDGWKFWWDVLFKSIPCTVIYRKQEFCSLKDTSLRQNLAFFVVSLPSPLVCIYIND